MSDQDTLLNEKVVLVEKTERMIKDLQKCVDNIQIFPCKLPQDNDLSLTSEKISRHILVMQKMMEYCLEEYPTCLQLTLIATLLDKGEKMRKSCREYHLNLLRDNLSTLTFDDCEKKQEEGKLQ
jgi:hypothetical protein